MPVPDPHVPSLIVTIAATALYLAAVAAILIPSVVALYVKFVDMPRLRASNHAIANNSTVTSLQASANAERLDQLASQVTTALKTAQELSVASHSPTSNTPVNNSAIRPDGVPR